MKKRDIENHAISGLPLQGADVVSRRGNVLTFRHVWHDTDDGRILHGVRTAAMSLAREIANASGKSVTVYAKEGHVVECIEPEAS